MHFDYKRESEINIEQLSQTGYSSSILALDIMMEKKVNNFDNENLRINNIS